MDLSLEKLLNTNSLWLLWWILLHNRPMEWSIVMVNVIFHAKKCSYLCWWRITWFYILFMNFSGRCLVLFESDPIYWSRTMGNSRSKNRNALMQETSLQLALEIICHGSPLCKERENSSNHLTYPFSVRAIWYHCEICYELCLSFEFRTKRIPEKVYKAIA